jgi:hypothetical protein
MRIGSKKIYHLEAWVVKVMSLYKVSAFWREKNRVADWDSCTSNPSISSIFQNSSDRSQQCPNVSFYFIKITASVRAKFCDKRIPDTAGGNT